VYPKSWAVRELPPRPQVGTQFSFQTRFRKGKATRFRVNTLGEPIEESIRIVTVLPNGKLKFSKPSKNQLIQIANNLGENITVHDRVIHERMKQERKELSFNGAKIWIPVNWKQTQGDIHTTILPFNNTRVQVTFAFNQHGEINPLTLQYGIFENGKNTERGWKNEAKTVKEIIAQLDSQIIREFNQA